MPAETAVERAVANSPYSSQHAAALASSRHPLLPPRDPVRGGPGTSFSFDRAAVALTGSAAVGAYLVLRRRSDKRRTSRRRWGSSFFRRRSPDVSQGAAEAEPDEAADSQMALPKPPMVIFLAVFLHLLGFTMSGPIIPGLRQHFSLAAAKTGLISSAFPLGVFFAVTIFPALSDRIGRKPVLLMSYLGVGIGFVLQGLAVSCGLPFRAFIALRVASGAFAGASTVVKAYLADIATKETLPKFMAYREAAATLAFIVGPTISGLLLSLTNVASVVVFSGVTSLLAAVMVLFFLLPPKLRSDDEEQPRTAQKPAKPEASESAETKRPLSRRSRWSIIVMMMIVGFAYNIGQSFFDSFFAVLMVERFGITPAVLGPLLTGLACVVFVTASCIYYPLVRWTSTTAVAAIGLTMIGMGMSLLGSASTMTTVSLAIMLYGVGLPLFTPSVPIVLAEVAPKRKRGFILGIDSAVNTVARIMSPTIMGIVYQGQGAHVAFQRAAVVIFAGSVLLVSMRGALKTRGLA
mmetsp:Transcript_27325/g.63702  ORF Transcript_27325/g.63702 Transcript_27325/m.63702 type:complete len:520 (+) Transcript_27325:53-1612(+)